MKKLDLSVAILDFDETLSEPFGVLRADTASRVKRLLRKLSLIPVIVSGRPMSFLRPEARHIGCTRYVGENGNAVHAGGKDKYLEDGSAIVSLFSPRRYEVKKSMVEFPGKMLPAAKRLLERAGAEYCMEWNNGRVMIMPPNTSKLRGLEFLFGRTGFSFSDAIAFGNGENDIGFMKKSRISVAVSNALPQVKRQADFVSGRPYGEGVIRFLEAALPPRGPCIGGLSLLDQ